MQKENETIFIESKKINKIEDGETSGRKGRKGVGAGQMTAWTEMPSISQGAKALEMAASFRESKANEEGEINS